MAPVLKKEQEKGSDRTGSDRMGSIWKESDRIESDSKEKGALLISAKGEQGQFQTSKMKIQIEQKSTIRQFSVEIEGLAPLSFSKHYDASSVPLLNDKEAKDAYEQRTWRNRLHFNKEGQCYVPQTCIKNSLVETAKYLRIKMPGKGNSEYGKHFERGILVDHPMMLDAHRDEVRCETYFVPSDGKKGGGKRVKKNFPVIEPWGGIAVVLVLDDDIPNEVFARVFHEAGRFNGWGRFRPQTGGFYGRFIVKDIDMETI